MEKQMGTSVIADKIALKLVGADGYCVTEAGFGADIGLEKFMNIKCRSSGLAPDCVVIVATVRALKMHGGGPPVVAGKALDNTYRTENIELTRAGCCNLTRHIMNLKNFGIPVIVGINRFATDTDQELDVVREEALKSGADSAVVCEHHAKGGAGAVDVARAVIDACSKKSNFKFLYDLDLSIKEKIEIIAREFYHAGSVEYMPKAEEQIQQYTHMGFDKLPICMAKTQYSFSADASLKGAPSGFVLPIREIRASVGAGFLYPLVGDMNTMPGLPTRPCYYEIDIDPNTGVVVGLS